MQVKPIPEVKSKYIITISTSETDMFGMPLVQLYEKFANHAADCVALNSWTNSSLTFLRRIFPLAVAGNASMK